MKGVAHARAESDIAIVNRIKRDQIHLLHIRFSVFGKEFVGAHNIENIGYDIITGLVTAKPSCVSRALASS